MKILQPKSHFYHLSKMNTALPRGEEATLTVTSTSFKSAVKKAAVVLKWGDDSPHSSITVQVKSGMSSVPFHPKKCFTVC